MRVSSIPQSNPACHFDIQLDRTGRPSDEDAQVFRRGSLWNFRRGDFRRSGIPAPAAAGFASAPIPIRSTPCFASLIRLYSPEQGGFLVHAASAIRGGAAYLFAGVSGVGKTTMSRLAPPDATVLTDEISYVRKIGTSYRAYGTPFAGELARSGANTSAPLRALYPAGARPIQSHRVGSRRLTPRAP